MSSDDWLALREIPDLTVLKSVLLDLNARLSMLDKPSHSTPFKLDRLSVKIRDGEISNK